jgi:uncharacterized membrane protein
MTVTTAIRQRQLLHPRLVGPGAALLMAAFATDLIYWRTPSFLWETFSIWLLVGGLVLAGLSALAFLLDIALHRLEAIDWRRFTGLAAATLLSILNAFIHSRDGYTAVVEQGLMLSGAVTVLLLVVGRRGWSLGAPRAVNFAQQRRAGS